jgi:dinuclear metal center YbgI/SA1388 family protein
MIDIIQLSGYLDDLLEIHSISDSPNAHNGLQIQNSGEIKKIGLAVDACSATIQMAVERNCDAMFVHHGLFWGGTHPIRGKLFEKVSTMIRANLGLYSAHLPLDMHPVLGNNKTLADKVGLTKIESFGVYNGIKIGLKGKIARKPISQLGKDLESSFQSSVKVIGENEVESLAIVTGGAGELISQAAKEGLDCYLTGEGANQHFHEAIEGGCGLIFAGHYATETGGVQAVGAHLKHKFDIEAEFLDYPTGL